MMDIDITEDQFLRWKGGELIQVAMPNITPAEREFLMTGATQEEWDEVFKPLEDDDDVTKTLNTIE